MELSITHIWPQIAIDSTPGQQSIQQPQADLKIKRKPMSATVEGEPVQIQIDQYQCFAEAGQKNIRDLIREYAAKGRSKLLSGIARRAREGEQKLDIAHNKGNIIAQIAKQEGTPKPAPLGIKFIPQSRPEIRFVGGTKTKVDPGYTQVNITPRQPIIDYNPGQVTTYLQQRPELYIEWLPDKLDKLV